MDRLLLHHCCAPCSVKVVEALETDFAIESFWHNPNIHPVEEYEKRFQSLADFCRHRDLALHVRGDGPGNLWPENLQCDGPGRCRMCYAVRLKATAEVARSLGIPCFSTTLLSSPHQKHELIKAVGMEVGEQERLRFVYKDFRPYYYRGKDEARKAGLYMQKYCGCEVSLKERLEARNRRKPLHGAA